MQWPQGAAWPLTVPRVQGQGTVITGHPVLLSENPGLAFRGKAEGWGPMKTHEALGGKDEEEARPIGVGWRGGLRGPGSSNPAPALVGFQALGGLILTLLWWALGPWEV